LTKTIVALCGGGNPIAAPLCATEWKHDVAHVGDIDLHFVEAGSGPLVLLLHGFPEFWYAWRNQLPLLAAAGFRAVAPDLRGYNQSSRPRRIADYRVRNLVNDVLGLIRWFGEDQADVVGHDWGGVIAWRLAQLHPQLVGKLIVLNAPHPAAFRRELKRSPLQWVRSSYTVFFQLPYVPEQVLRAGKFKLLERGWRKQPRRPGAFNAKDIAEYKRALSLPGGLTGPLNYYRAAMRWPGDLFCEPQVVIAPTLLLWGSRDPFLSVRLSDGLSNWVSDLRVRRFHDASHWLQHDLPEEVSKAIADFCGNN
jgi:pimeloyl-ACP methyl ester carboxylesterase